MSEKKHIKLYTKKGDKGKTSLFNGSRCNKSDPIFSTLGDLDELNCAIGLLISHWGVHSSLCVDKSFLRKIQYHLVNISSVVATPGEKGEKLIRITEKDILEIEKKIDYLQSVAEKLSQFILPGPQPNPTYSYFVGDVSEVLERIKISIISLVSSQAHVCRTISRRAERSVLGLWNNEPKKEANILIYLNRLSDFFFAYSRAVIAPENRLDEITMADMNQRYEYGNQREIC